MLSVLLSGRTRRSDGPLAVPKRLNETQNNPGTLEIPGARQRRVSYTGNAGVRPLFWNSPRGGGESMDVQPISHKVGGSIGHG